MGRHDRGQIALVSDEQIVELYWERNETAIKLTADKYEQLLFRIAYNILHDDPDCKECLNDTYLGIWNAIPPSRPSVFAAFITRIMRNIAIDKYKEKTRRKRVPSAMTVSLEEIQDTLAFRDASEAERVSGELAKLINDYLRNLSERQRYVFISRFYMGDSFEQIAGELHIHPSTVYRETEKIKRGLKNYLERNGVYV